jgi:hypothetical protein
MTGGAGADTFVLHPSAVLSVITDFERGIDRLDLSAWPMLRAPDQVQITPSASGAVISYRGAQVQITASNAAPLSRADLFAGGVFQSPDRLMVPQTDSGGQHSGGDDSSLPVLYARGTGAMAGARLFALDGQTGVPLANVTTDTLGRFAFPAGQSGTLALDPALEGPRSAIGSADVADLLRMAFGRAPVFVAGRGQTMGDLLAADVNGDGAISFRDALAAHRIIQGLSPVPDAVVVPRAWAEAPATTLPGSLPDAALSADAVLIFRGDLDASALWVL